MRVLVTGATGYLGWRHAALLRERGHEVTALARPGHRERAAARDLETVSLDAGGAEARALVAGHDAVLHFAGVPDPAGAARDPARAVRENAGTTVNLLDGCAEHGAVLVYPSSARAGVEPPPDAYAMSKRLGEDACLLHAARAVVLRLTSVFGPGQVAWEGATGAIAAFAARALDGRPISIPGNPRRTRDFLYVDDLVEGVERLLEGVRPLESTPLKGSDPSPPHGLKGSDPSPARGLKGSDPSTRASRGAPSVLYAGSGVATPLIDAARLALDAAGSRFEVETPGGELPPGEDESYALEPGVPRLALTPRPLPEAVAAYVDWLRLHPAAQGRARA
ncbi:MAG TPA: NAD(P)-dependent oxidoreductase [Solirubrobacteraceae bacterium]|jgi:nucleoside-diphosphate-sugar epimerase|nr:NAD(P)-dependent oxidoreductase [Solirubrobacteraceae bacterium]